MFTSRKIALLGMAAAALVSATSLITPAAASPANGKAMTWMTYNPQLTPLWSANWIAMRALPGNADVTLVGCMGGSTNPVGCDAYNGDTAITGPARHILCSIPDASGNPLPEPNGYAAVFAPTDMSNVAVQNWRFYYGWSGKWLGLTAPVPGSALNTPTAGDAKCVQKFGAGALMAEHHMNGTGGWATGGKVHPASHQKSLLIWGTQTPKPRFWTRINNQPNANTY